MMVESEASSAAVAPKRSMRKGTRSCLACRKRKIRCIFEQADRCTRCDERGLQCIAQDQASPSEALYTFSRSRVRRKEKDSCHRICPVSQNERPGSCCASANSIQDYNSSDGEDNFTTSLLEVSEAAFTHTFPPYLKLALSRTNGFQMRSTQKIRYFDSFCGCGSYASEAQSKAGLLSHFPTQDYLAAVVDMAADWWSMHNAVHLSPSIDSKKALLDGHRNVHDATKDSFFAAAWLTCWAITLLQTQPMFSVAPIFADQEPSKDLRHIVHVIDRYLSHDSRLQSLPGIECAVIFAKLIHWLGHSKQAWILSRRALAGGQLLGLHRLSQNGTRADDIALANSSPENAPPEHRAALIWTELQRLDQFLSFLLFLPPSTPFDEDHDDSATSLGSWQNLSNRVISRLSQRDSLNCEQAVLTETTFILNDLESFENTNKVLQTRTHDCKLGAMATAMATLMQISFLYLCIRAHLPLVLRAAKEHQCTPNVLACIQACRELLRMYFAVRTIIARGIFISRTCDMHAALACFVLLLYQDRSKSLLPPTDDWAADASLLQNAKFAMSTTVVCGTDDFVGPLLLSLDETEYLESLAMGLS